MNQKHDLFTGATDGSPAHSSPKQHEGQAHPQRPLRHARSRRNPRLLWLAAAIFVMTAAERGSAQVIDLNSNGMSDIWEEIFNAASVNPGVDTDNDGVKNQQESVAGTDPFDPNSRPMISLLSHTGTNVTVTVPCARGKRYELQSVPALDSGSLSNWTTEVSVIVRSGDTVALAAPANTTGKFFRIAVADVDTDGDGVNDWEEYQLGLDPLAAASSGQLDGNGQPLNDYAYATGQLAKQNVISIYAADATAVQPESGNPASSEGMFVVQRDGFPLRTLTVNLALGGPGPGFAAEGVDHAIVPRPITLPAGVSSQTLPLTPMANPNRVSPVIATLELLSGPGYTVGTASNASVVVYPSTTPKGTGLTAEYYTNSSTTYANFANFNPSNLWVTRIDTNVNFIWGTASTPPITNNGRYSVRWTGQVQPQYSETYYFEVRSDDGVKLWVNDQLLIDKWAAQSLTSWTNTIALQGGVRYNIKLEFLDFGVTSPRATLYWYSDSFARQVIPMERLYPTNVSASPSAVTSPLTAVAFLGQPFSYTVSGANSPLGYTASGLPPGLGFDSGSGVISGTPNLAGAFPVTLTSSNSAGLGASLVEIQVIDTGSAVTREVWNGVAGTSISDIPLGTPPNNTAVYGSLQGITDYGDDYAERIRGYITAPTTGNYRFWLSGSDSAELWISNDAEPANKVRRAFVLPGGTAPQQWNLQASQRAPWLAMVAGQRYYIEVLHKAGVGAGDNWAVGWLLDPTGTNSAPGGLVPGYLLSRHFDKPPAFIPGTLYGANLLAQSGALSTGSGSATLRVNAEETQAVLKYSHGNLTGPVTAKHIHSDQYLNRNNQGQIIFDIDAATPQPDGSYVWDIAPVGTLSVADIREIIREGKAYLNIHTVMYPAGEIKGNFTPAVGAQSFTPPPAPPAWTDDHANAAAAARFLIQATFGPTLSEITSVQALGYEGWITNQFALPIAGHLTNVLAKANADPANPYPSTLMFNTWWQQAVSAPDQLRQRVAFALSEIMVVSQNGVLQDNARALSSYYDTLLQHSFGNYRELLEAVTLTPSMGLYLDMRRNEKGSILLGTHPNENYAREILQLFSVGLYRLWPDGTLVMNSEGNLVPTYLQDEILGFSRVFTGWNYYQVNPTNASRLPFNWSPGANYTTPMVLVPSRHETGTKRLLDNVMLPPAWGNQTNVASVEFDNYGLQDLELALDSIFYNENVGPFICRQLIQRLVTSHPSRDYLYRVVQKFNDNGAGVRGDMQAVIKAILLDYEARSSTALAQPTFGKQREPLCRVTAPARAFAPPAPISGTYSQNGNQTITVTTASPHRLVANSDDLAISFTDTSGQPPPPSQNYDNVSVTSPTTFNVNAPGVLSGTYTQAVNITISNMLTASFDTTNVIMVNISGHGLTVGNPVFLHFPTGGAVPGVYQIISRSNANSFVVTTAEAASRNGTCLIPKLTGGGFVQSTTNVTFSTTLPHGLQPGDPVFILFSTLAPTNGQYQVIATNDATHFTIYANSANQTANGQVIFPLVPPPLVRSGNASVRYNTWNMNQTDTGSTSSLSQTPLNSPTVFNFFFPDYKFPGTLASAGLTTPEFQLTSDTEAVLQMNFLTLGILGNGSNTNGLSSYNNGNGALMLDIGPWMTPANTANAGIPGLVDSLNSLLCGGQLASSARSTIINYVANNTNFPYTTPTATQMRDRVRAIIHLIVNSPDFTVQR